MHDVLAWTSSPDAAKSAVLAYLRRSPATAYVADVAQFLSTNDKTRSSITSTIWFACLREEMIKPGTEIVASKHLQLS